MHIPYINNLLIKLLTDTLFLNGPGFNILVGNIFAEGPDLSPVFVWKYCLLITLLPSFLVNFPVIFIEGSIQKILGSLVVHTGCVGF